VTDEIEEGLGDHRILLDHILVPPLARRGVGGDEETLAPGADVLDRHAVEALLDGACEIFEDVVGDIPLLLRPEHDRTFDRAEHVTEADLVSLAREGEATARTALRLDEAGAFQRLEDLLEEAQGDVLARRDVPNLNRRVAMNREVEDGANGVAPTVREAEHAFNVVVASENSRTEAREVRRSKCVLQFAHDRNERQISQMMISTPVRLEPELGF